jgi:hypothetical protein
VQFRFAKGAVTIGVTQRFDQPDLFVITDGFSGQARAVCYISNIHGIFLFCRCLDKGFWGR